MYNIIQNQNNESLIKEFNLEFNNKKFIFSLYDIGNDSMKILAKSDNDNSDEISFDKYGIILQLEELKNLQRYFRMFDNLEDAMPNIKELIEHNSISITEIKQDEITINFNLHTIQNDSMVIILNKIKNNEKEDIALLIKGYHQQKKEIKELKNKINEMSNIITNLTRRIEKLENPLDINSNIIKNNNELKLVLNAITSNIRNISLELLFDSESDGENSEKLKSAYLGKNDILVLVQTKKNKRFGAYAHEAFFNRDDYKKSDNKAFLFSLDKMKIYKSTGSTNSIWNYEGNSIDFGSGTDLRIFHKFRQENNYTSQSKSDYIYDEHFALNGERNFEIKYLEIYRVIFN